MSTIQWNDNLASGSPDIDTQHKELFQRINSLLDALAKNADKNTTDRQEVSKIIQFLTEYVVFHFGTEEKYMAKFNYSSTSAHKA